MSAPETASLNPGVDQVKRERKSKIRVDLEMIRAGKGWSAMTS